MKVKAELLDSIAMERALKRISHEIVEKNKGVSDLVLLGIVRGGVPVCQKLAENIFKIENQVVPSGKIDITGFRDDRENQQVSDNISDIGISLKDKVVVLCDDVLYKGRTVRAAIEAVLRFGRPKSIQLAVLIDRGHRELPIRADYVGKNVPTSCEEVVQVIFDETNGNRAVILAD